MLEKGQLIGNYRILEEIGRGGMGIVYKAQHSMIKEKIMAIKTIHDFIISMSKVIERFKQEANVMYSLRNPNIVYVEDLDEQDGIYFIVMEYVEGESLRQRLQREKTIPVKEALNIALNICQGLEVAHSRKPPVIHRDLKPENILITTDNDIKITDFGLAKIVGNTNISMMSKLSVGEIPTDGISQKRDLSIGDLPTDVKDEISQISPGTFAYMSPEQRRGEELDIRTDIYSLGLIVYEMLIGKLPAGLRPSLPSHVLGEATKELDEFLIKCLEEDREDRCISIIELKAGLTNQGKRVGVAPEYEMEKEPSRIIEVEHRPTHVIHPWGMFGHDPQHTGRSPYNGPKNPRLKWAFPTGGRLVSPPAIGLDGTIYVGSYDKKLYAIHPDGSLKWEFATGNKIESSPAIGMDGTIYIGSWDYKFYAINSNGIKKWEFITGGVVQSSPTIISNGIVYVGSWDDKLYAINPNGRKKWAFDAISSIRSSPAIGVDGIIYVCSFYNNLYAIYPNGSKRWEFPIRNEVESSPAIGANGTIYVGPADKKLYAVKPDGRKEWEFSTRKAVCTYPAIGADGTIYVGSDDCHLYAINSNGSMKWKFNTGVAIGLFPTIGADGIIYVGALKLYAINPNGSMMWEFLVGNGIRSSPAIGVDGTIYVCSDSGRLYAIGEK